MERKHPLANCEQCPLWTAKTYVPSYIPEGADLAIVGEAPGHQEAKTGKLFTGPSGRLLNIVLDHYGLRKRSTMLSNATLCRPEDGKAPPTAAIAACRDRLLDELGRPDIKDIIVLGNSAAQSVLRSTSGITHLRVGPGRHSADLPWATIYPTVHPAACLRQADMFPNLVTDIGKVVNRSEPWVDPIWRLFDTPVEALKVIEELQRGTGPIAIDIEVDIDKDTSFDHPDRHHLLCIGVSYAPGKAVVFGENVCQDKVVLDALGNLFRSRPLIAQNGKFDLAGLYRHCGALTLWFDTMIASYTFDERPGVHGLKYMAVEYLGAPQYDAEIKQYIGPKDGYGIIPKDKLYLYNATDCVATYALWQMFEKRYESNAELRSLHDFLVDKSNALMYVELNGFPVDLAYLDILTDQYIASLQVIEDDIDEIIKPVRAGGINPRSPQQVKALLADLKINVASTDEETLTALLERTKPDTISYQFVSTLLKHRKETKLYGTYVKGTRKRVYRGRVYPTFLLHGTTTGRLSCRNPNLQNIPRDSTIRALFVASSSDNVLIQTDYSQAELRVLSYLAGDQYFRDIFNGGERDLFDELTPILYPGVKKEDVGAAAFKEYRIRVKAYVYGLSYGREAASIATEYKIPVQEAVKGMARFFEVIPEIVAFREETRKKVLRQEDLITPFGRHRRFHLITDENRHNVMNEALAFLPQSTSSDLCLRAMARLRQDFKGNGIYIRNIVHDSIIVEAPRDAAEQVMKQMDFRMVESAQELVGDYVKFATDSKMGKNWGEL